LNTEAGVLSNDDKIEILKNEIHKMASVLDTMYLEIATLIEILAEKELITPESWSAKIKTVSEDMQKRLEEAIREQNSSGQANVENSGKPDETEGSGKIIVPDSGIIIP